ncbi:hypothetical protein [Streptomyces sp. NPDC047869]|uniref:hypothetical protein n=1 Tax=Streptomyces sp. NPDC047869 TaxID=3154709 RepID=UPI0034573693
MLSQESPFARGWYAGCPNIFIAAHHALTEADGWLRPASPTGAVLRTLQLVGLDTLIDCHETLDTH